VIARSVTARSLAARTATALAVGAVAVTVLAGGCAARPATTAPPDEAAVVVASFGFSESRVLGELYALAMEQAGIPVRRVPDLASREVVQPALEQGVVDFVAEYSGTALEFSNQGAGQATADPVATHRALQRALADRGLTVLGAAPAQDQNALAVTRATADRFDLGTVSDLEPLAGQLVLGGPPECPERKFCLPGLRATYGLEFHEFRTLDAAGPLTVGALEGGEIDVGLMFTTSPAAAEDDLVLLVDDRGLQPAENVVPIVRTAVLTRYGASLQAAVDTVSASLTTAELVGLNRAVHRGGAPADVARAWLSGHDPQAVSTH
jgi:osmoprotectant transport system substrate-binding protein